MIYLLILQKFNYVFCQQKDKSKICQTKGKYKTMINNAVASIDFVRHYGVQNRFVVKFKHPL